MADRHWLYLSAFLRASGLSMLAIVTAASLHALGLQPLAIAAIATAGLAGCLVAALLATLFADRWGRRRTLAATAVLTGAVSVVLSFAAPTWVLGAAAFLGMWNAMGRDRGAALMLEQAALPATVSDRLRTATFARYHVAQDLGHAVGAGAAAMPSLLVSVGMTELAALRFGICVAALLIGCSALPYSRLSRAVESVPSSPAPTLSPAGRRIVVRISLLFLLDSVGGGFLTTSWLSVFFLERFGVSVDTVALLFVGARVLNAGSHLAAAWLAARIGLVNTMVFAHLPSSLLLLTVAFSTSFPVAAVLFLLREGLVEMDVPTRQSYLMAVVSPAERTRASGVTSLVRVGGWAIGQAAAGAAGQVTLALSLGIGAAMKIAYDLLLFAVFRRIVPPEEA